MRIMAQSLTDTRITRKNTFSPKMFMEKKLHEATKIVATTKRFSVLMSPVHTKIVLETPQLPNLSQLETNCGSHCNYSNQEDCGMEVVLESRTSVAPKKDTSTKTTALPNAVTIRESLAV